MTHTINHRAGGTWARCEGDLVTITGYTENGRAAYIQRKDGTKPKGPLPVTWLTKNDTTEGEF